MIQIKCSYLAGQNRNRMSSILKRLRNHMHHYALVCLSLAAITTVGCGVTSQGQNSASAIKAISPASVVAGGPTFTLTVMGSGYSADSLVTVDNQVRATTFVSDTQLKAVILASDIGKPGVKPLAVYNPHVSAPLINSAALNVQSSGSPQNSTLQITTTSLPTGAVGASYTAALAATNGVPPYTWGISGGQLPPGVNLQPASGLISGMPSQSGTFSFAVEVTDSTSQSTSVGLSATIGSPSSPVVASASPNSGSTAGGTSVTITGANFQTGATVSFGGAAASSLTVLSATQIRAITPAHNAGSTSVSVQDPDGQSSTLNNGFAYTSVSQLQVTTNTLPAGAVSVSYTATLTAANGVPPYTWGISSGQLPPSLHLQASSGQVSGTPSQSGTFSFSAKVTDSTNQSASAGLSATIAPPSSPVVSSISPSSGPTGGGTLVTVNGANFQPGATVSFGGTAASSPTVSSSAQIKAVTPAHLAGNADVIVQNPNGESSTLSNGFVYNVPSPTVASVSPNNGPTTGGTKVTITGTNFLAGALVLFGTTPATTVTINSATQIQAVSPVHAAGPVDVTVEDPGNVSAKLSGGFSYTSSSSGPPTISSISPNSGTPGTQVTIKGTNFISGVTVAFGNTNAASTTFASATELTSSVPNLGTGTYNVTVTDPDPASATLNNGFTVTAPAKAGNQGLLSGMTPSNFTLPAGWTLAAKQDFESGSLPPGQALSSGASITCSFGHSGNCSATTRISYDNAADQWFFSEGQLTGREYYLSFYDNGNGVLFNEEYVLNHYIKHNLGGSAGFEESAVTIFANGSACAGPSGGIMLNCPNAQTVNGTQGNYVHQNNADYGPIVMGYGSTGWNQWEIWMKANTPNNSDGWLRVYRNGVLFWDRENINQFGPVDMTGMQVEAGGWYTKNVWTNNGQRPNAGGTCSPGAGLGIESGSWDGNFSTVTAKDCAPAPPVFNRYIDDIILLEK
jgi:hypothetical protein